MPDHSQRALLKLMEEISNKHYRTKWESGLEYILWHWIHHDSPLSRFDINRLFTAHTRCRGWFAILDEESEDPVFLHTDKWIRLFQDEFDGATS